MILNSAFAVDIYIMNEYNLKITGVKGNIEMIDIIDIGINYIIEMTVVWQYFRSFYSAKRSKQTEHVFMISAYVILFGLFWLRCIFRKNCASVPEERSAIPLQTEQSSAG